MSLPDADICAKELQDLATSIDIKNHLGIIWSIDIMPIYEYACTTCGKEFEKLVRQSSPAPACPSCHSVDLRKKLSAFSAITGSGASDFPGPCGSCGHPDGPGACHFQ
ncbi:MAG: zinc ribbon domain-containing protein [Candidatus Accumulibacter phosphatis]|jgi:putative FmdB family regulatory protein